MRSTHYLRYVRRKRRESKRRGVVAVLVLVMTATLVGFAALTVDVGVLYHTRQDLQDSADAAAMAGASALTRDVMMQVRQTNNSAALGDVLFSVSDRASITALLNPSWGTLETQVVSSDIVTGYLNLASATSALQAGATPSTFNAIQVTVHRESGGLNGAVEYFFAPIFGASSGATHATATAAFDDRFAGIDLDVPGAGALPITLHQNEFNLQWGGSGSDDHGFDYVAESVTGGSDGIREVNIFPYMNLPGNFGILNIGTPNQGVPGLRDQIENGVSTADLESEVGTSELVFYDSAGSAVTYSMTGDPGMKSGLTTSLQSRIGDVVSFFLHSQAVGTGANAVYTIVQIRYGRLMAVNLTGPPSGRGIWIQPGAYDGGEIIVSANAPSSNGLVGRLVLAR